MIFEGLARIVRVNEIVKSMVQPNRADFFATQDVVIDPSIMKSSILIDLIITSSISIANEF